MKRYLSILIIDDEPAIRNGIANMLLSEFGSSTMIYQASDGRKGLEIATEKNPSLIISDIVMTEMTGLELIAELRRNGQEIPTIMISGYDEFKYAQEAIRLGVVNYILKPIDRNELVSTIRNITLKKDIQDRDEKDILRAATEHFLQQLITGEIKSEEEADHGARSLSLQFDRKIFTVCIVRSDNPDIQMISESTTESGIYNLVINRNLVLIIPSDETYAIHEVKLLTERYEKAIASAGRTVESYSLLSLSYQYALQALSYSIYYPDEKILYSKHITNGKPAVTPNDINTRELKTFILEGDEEPMRNWVEDFYQKLLMTTTLPPPSFVKGMSIFVLSDIQKNLTDNLSIPKEYFEDINSTILNTIYRLDDLKSWMLKQLLHISHSIVPEARVANMPEIHIAKKYVENNLDRIVSSNEIAEKLGMNPTYFSTYFKQKTGENFRNYVNKVKNDKAKELLAIPDLTIEEIGHSLGYSDYRSFHRIFKQQNDISPTAYRKKLLKEKK